jgi:lipoyl synthase
MTKLRKPSWIRSRTLAAGSPTPLPDVLRELRLNTVCREAACPNRGRCWEKSEVTFLILGRACTRSCRFCNVEACAAPEPPDPSETENVARAVERLGCDYTVITSVTRDDLTDGGCAHFLRTVAAVKDRSRSAVELLIPDFGGRGDLVAQMARSRAEVIGHNLEIPERLYAALRPKSSYARSLKVLESLKNTDSGIAVKTALMVGLGETQEEILTTARDAVNTGVDIFYLGQYLQPSLRHAPVLRYYTPKEFEELGDQVRQLGFGAVLASPLVRSSYRAKESYEEHKLKIQSEK